MNKHNNISSPFFDNIHAYNGMQHTRYTTSIRNLVYSSFTEEEYNNLLSGYKNPHETIQRGIDIIFNFDYPILNKTFTNSLYTNINPKDMFEKAFVTKYFTDEIAYESFAEFQMKLLGKLLEVMPTFNMKCMFLFNTEYKDIWGGYTIDETFDNTHKDTNDTDTDTKSVSSRFPVNNTNVYVNIDSENYATNGNGIKGKNNHKNNGEYHNTRKLDRTEKADYTKLKEFMSVFNKLITSTLNEFNYLFMGIG